MKRETKEREGQPSLGISACVLLLLIVLWIAFVGGTRRNEMLVGGAVVALTSTFAFRVWKIELLELRLRWGDLIQAWRIPWYVLSGVYEIIVILLKDLLGIERAQSYYRVSGFKTSQKDPLLVSKRILATFYTTMAPNFIVIGIDPDRSRMLFHQLERSDVPLMTKALGAQPGARRP